jgi:formiminotetrahydrofolate cyclodeaminase
MVGNFTSGRKKHAAVAPQVEARLEGLGHCMKTLEHLVQKDIDAYGAVGAGFAMPRDTDEERSARSAHIQQASIQATEVLFEIADACVAVGDNALWLAKHGNANLRADAVMAVLLAEAALQGTVVTVSASLGYIKDASVVASMRERLRPFESAAAMRQQALALGQAE